MESQLPELMKAHFLDNFKKPYELRSIPLPTLSSPHDLLIKVEAASYCHTDAVLAEGTVVSTHSPDGPFQIGDRVGVPGRAFHPCGKCYECSDTERAESDYNGYSVYCPSAGNHGISRPGGFAEYAVVDARQLALIPEPLTAVDTAPLMCAGLTIYGALKKSHLRPGQRVGIMGCGGGLGHLGLQFATKMGYRALGLDTAEAPLKLAKGLGTGARIVDVKIESAEEILQQLGKEDGQTDRSLMGLDAVLILPESQKAFDYGMKLLKNHGKIILVSFPKEGFHFSAADVVFRDISIVGSLVASNKTLKEMLAFAAHHNVRAVVKTFPPSRLNELVEEYHKGGGGKLVLDMSLSDSYWH